MPDQPSPGLSADVAQRAANALAAIRGAADILAAPDLSESERAHWHDLIARRVQELHTLLRGTTSM